ncbi:hypothetical protein LCGC14_0996420 [marine sediment metagenome]|uniref:Uncharacterized protein n=1 Tax=marine sediment metagenome TaxID=412755 RepID=A0A0F9NQS7_9ZZZZ
MDNKRKTLKEKWNETDELCFHCGNVTKEIKGLTKQNVKKLFRKPNSTDVALLLIIILTITGSFLYVSEVQSLREVIKNPQELCSVYYSSIAYGNFDNLTIENPPNITWQNS